MSTNLFHELDDGLSSLELFGGAGAGASVLRDGEAAAGGVKRLVPLRDTTHLLVQGICTHSASVALLFGC